MDQVIEKHESPQLTQSEIDHLNSSITIKEIQFMILKYQKEKSTDSDDFTGEFHQMFKELTPVYTISSRK